MPAPRERWIDVVRGCCAIGVVLHHATALGAAQGWSHPVTDLLDAALSPFRMPLLMTISGLVLGGALAQPFGRFAIRRARTLVWPYLVWSVVVLAATGGLVPAALVRIWTVAPTYLWFLQFLAVFAIAAWLLRRLPTQALLSVAALSVTVSGFLPETHRADRFAYLFGFFLLGVAARRWRPSGARAIAVSVGGATAVVLLLIALAAGERVRYEAAAAPLVALAVVALVALARSRPFPGTRSRPRRRPVQDGLAHLGQNAVVPYVTHLVVLTGLLGAAGAADESRSWPAPVIVVTASAVAVLCAVAVIAARGHRAVAVLFELPSRPRQVGSGPPASTSTRPG